MRILSTAILFILVFGLPVPNVAKAEEKFTLRIREIPPDVNNEGYPKTKRAPLILGAGGVTLMAAGFLTIFVHPENQNVLTRSDQSGIGIGVRESISIRTPVCIALAIRMSPSMPYAANS